VVEEVLAAQRDGIIYAAMHTREIEAAERVLSVLGWAETITLIGHGMWVARRGIWYVSAAHTEADVSETLLNRIERAFRAFSEA
jgi:hypothetical protein